MVFGFSQTLPTQVKCGTAESMQQFRRIHPNAETEKQFEDWLKTKIQERQASGQVINTNYIIPIIFHIVHDTAEAIGTGSNLSFAKILSQLMQLNEDYANLSGSAYGVAANIQIQFCLAKVDPNGNVLPEAGIDRINPSLKGWHNPPYDGFVDSSYIDQTIMPSSYWDSYKYFNVWTLEIAPVINTPNPLLGKATFPTSSSLQGLDQRETDSHAGVFIDYRTVGSIVNAGVYGNKNLGSGRILTHESGHFFGLLHIWGNDPNNPSDYCEGTDYCSDTPPQNGPSSALTTCLSIGTSNNCIPSMPKMFENYMDYTGDLCKNTFTTKQKERMQTVMLNSPRRKELNIFSADLVIINQHSSPTTVIPGNEISVSFAEYNKGNFHATRNYVNFHLSPDSIFTPGSNGDIFLDTYFVDQSIGAFSGTSTFSKQIILPANVAPGTYYLFFAADGTDAIEECDESNNFATTRITVAPSCADLIITTPSVLPTSTTPGSSVTVQFAEKNIGNENAGPNRVRFLLSSDDVYTPGLNGDINLDEYYATQTLAPSTQTPLINKQLTIPASVADGAYYLFIAADATGLVTECDNTNNLAKVIVNISDQQTSTSQAYYRYWFDNQFSNAVSLNSPLGNDYYLQKSISTNLLSQGLHTFNIAFRDNGNKWSSAISSFFYKSNFAAPIGSASYEYWFDNNSPNRTVKSISSTSNLVVLDNLTTAGLSVGLHTIHVRFKIDGKNWSSTTSSFFYKTDANIVAGQAQYEHWFDSAYSSKIMTNNTSTNNFILFDTLNTNALSIGLHTLHFRFRPNGKAWSSSISSFFYKTEPNLAAGQAQYEYWFDSAYSSKTVTNNTSTHNFILLENINTSSLNNGLHTLHIRFRPDGKTWSSAISSFFYKDGDAIVPINNLAKYVYWYDNNWQNPKTISIINTQNIFWALNTDVSELSVGRHNLSMMFKDDRGKWSSIVNDSFIRGPLAIQPCSTGNRQFVAGVAIGPNSTFQWQINNGTGFVNISNNATYAGTNNDTLQLIGVPTSWYGYKYRCLVTNGNNTITGPTYIIKFAMTWNGSVSNDWENPANWNCNALPDANTDVYINASMPRYPDVNSNVSCRSLNLQPATSINIKPGIILTITGKE